MGQNDVRLYGQLAVKPRFRRHRGETEAYRCELYVKTMSRYNNSTEKGNIVYDEVCVMTESPEMIRNIGERLLLTENDMIYVKGVVCTTNVERKVICGECEEEFALPGSTCYVHPINIMKVEANVPKDTGYVRIRENVEVSNEVLVHGNVCTDINYSEEFHHSNYKLAVKRQYHILEDPADKRIDYPIINTYYQMADDDHEYLHKGSGMIVRGSLRARSIERKVICPNCGNPETIGYKLLEIVGHGTSYTNDWNKTGTNKDEDTDSTDE